MNSAVCTLFENHYHHGLVALVNSLSINGFQGSIYAGFKGSLPAWSSYAKENHSLNWEGAKTIDLNDGLRLHFLPVDTPYHLTNYKPQFMICLKEGLAKDAPGIIYFDPDIVIKCSWQFFEKWISYGVALVQEISNDPMPSSHPIRLGWNETIEKCNRQTVRKLDHYFNGGFCGVSIANIEFVKLWISVLDAASAQFKLELTQFVNSNGRPSLFVSVDQDALNISAMCSECPISEIGPDGMDFMPGGWIMSHATGSPKPWKKSYIRSVLEGKIPTIADRVFWSNVRGPIKIYNLNYIRWKKFSIALAGFIGRFYTRN